MSLSSSKLSGELEADFQFSPETSLLEQDPPMKSTLRSNCLTRPPPLSFILHLIVLLSSVAFFLSGLRLRRSANEYASNYPTQSHSSAVLQMVRFNGTFDRSSAFKGPPSSSVDEAWDQILPLGVMSVPENVFQNLNASRHAVEVPPEAGGGRLALFEALHLLHCVKNLWMISYPEYYTEEHQYSQEHPLLWHKHIDHCADMLRQKLMCDADNSLITYNWIRNHYKPHPNFNVEHQCRNYSQLLEEAKRYHLDGRLLPKGYIERPVGVHVVEFDEPPFDPMADS